MSNKIIGFYNSSERAEQVENDLIEAGFGRSDIHIYEGGDEPGLWDRMREWFGYADEEDRNLYHEAARRGGVAVVCDTSDENTPSREKALRIMQRHNPIDLDRQSTQWRSEGWQPGEGTAQSRPTGAGESESIPVIREELHVGKRAVIEGGVRIHSHVTEQPVERDVQLREERVEVERRPANRPVRPGERAFEERSIEATETSEKAVVSKEARVVEEVNVRKNVGQRTEKVRDTVRKTDVDVEKLSGERPGATSMPGTTAGTSGRDFDATGFAAEISRDPRYQGRDWNSCEPEFRKSYEQRYPQSKWEQVKDRVRAEYTRIRAR